MPVMGILTSVASKGYVEILKPPNLARKINPATCPPKLTGLKVPWSIVISLVTPFPTHMVLILCS